MTSEMADNLLRRDLAPTPARSNIRTPPRALTRSARNWSGPESTSASFRRSMYESYPRRRLELLARALECAEAYERRPRRELCAHAQMATELGAQPEDNEGLIDHIRAIEGVIVAAFFEELPEGKVRITLRSKDAAGGCLQGLPAVRRRRPHPRGGRAHPRAARGSAGKSFACHLP